MIRHDHEFAQTGIRIMVWDVRPTLMGDCTDFGMNWDGVLNSTEKMGVALGVNRDEISSRTGIIPSLSTQ